MDTRKTIDWTDDMVAKLKKMVGESKRDNAIAEVLRIPRRNVQKKRLQLKLRNYSDEPAIPDDFQRNARMPREQLATMYGVSSRTITNWRKFLGICVSPSDHMAYKTQSELDQMYSNIREGRKMPTKSVPLPRLTTTMAVIAPRDTSFVGLAAEYLRKHGYKPVAKIEYTQAKGPRGSYLVGRKVMSQDEMLMVAEGLGYRAVAL